MPNFFLNKINKSTVLSYHSRYTVCCCREYFLHINPPFFKMLSKGVKSIFSCSNAVHRFQATQLFMHLTVTAIPTVATTAKQGLSFTSMLSSRATLKTFAVFEAIVSCLFTSFSYICNAVASCYSQTTVPPCIIFARAN